jgi:hypothetical protein
MELGLESWQLADPSVPSNRHVSTVMVFLGLEQIYPNCKGYGIKSQDYTRFGLPKVGELVSCHLRFSLLVLSQFNETTWRIRISLLLGGVDARCPMS